MHIKYNPRVLIVYIIISGSLSELPETVTLGIKIKLMKLQSEKLKIINSSMLTENPILFDSILYDNVSQH